MHKVGGEVDTFCTRCGLTLAHTIIAMMSGKPVKVECNTCRSVHRYRSGASSSTSSTPASPKAPREKKTVISFDEVLRTKNLASAIPYSPKNVYQVDQVVDHAIFGTGFVSAVRDGGKIEVTFRSDVKTLIYGKS